MTLIFVSIKQVVVIVFIKQVVSSSLHQTLSQSINPVAIVTSISLSSSIVDIEVVVTQWTQDRAQQQTLSPYHVT